MVNFEREKMHALLSLVWAISAVVNDFARRWNAEKRRVVFIRIKAHCISGIIVTDSKTDYNSDIFSSRWPLRYITPAAMMYPLISMWYPPNAPQLLQYLLIDCRSFEPLLLKQMDGSGAEKDPWVQPSSALSPQLNTPHLTSQVCRVIPSGLESSFVLTLSYFHVFVYHRSNIFHQTFVVQKLKL